MRSSQLETNAARIGEKSMSASRRGAAGDAYISPEFTVSDWKNLDIGNSANPDWDRAIEIFHDRLDGRFLAPVDAVRNHKRYAIQEYSGFAIVAIDCLLIETLGQFYHGFDETPKPRDTALNPTHCTHRQFYMRFLEEISTLAPHFDTDPKRKLFYLHFRCGILHQAQTKKKSRIRYGEPAMVAFADAADPDQGLIVDRNRLHDALIKEIADYEAILKSGADAQKRANFIKKMDFITTALSGTSCISGGSGSG